MAVESPFVTGISAHDFLTYSAKAARHKRIYPYLRYGMLASSEKAIPGRAFTHNESLDFFIAIAGMSDSDFKSATFRTDTGGTRRIQAARENCICKAVHPGLQNASSGRAE